MKSVKRVLSLLLALLMMLSLSACGGFTSRLAVAAVKMSKLQSLRMDVDVDLGMNMSMFGEELPLDMSVTGPAEILTSPLKGKADLAVEMMDGTSGFLCYAEHSGDRFFIYTSLDNGRTWEKTEVDLVGLSSEVHFDFKSIAALTKLASAFQESGTETVKGSEAIVYRGSLAVADLKEHIDLPAILKSVEKSTNLKLDESSFDFSNVSPVPITICIDRHSSMLVKFAVVLTGLAQAVVRVVVQAVVKSAMDNSIFGMFGDLGGLNLGMFGIDIKLSRLVASAELYDFDAVGSITIPAEALAAETLVM